MKNRYIPLEITSFVRYKGNLRNASSASEPCDDERSDSDIDLDAGIIPRNRLKQLRWRLWSKIKSTISQLENCTPIETVAMLNVVKKFKLALRGYAYLITFAKPNIDLPQK